MKESEEIMLIGEGVTKRTTENGKESDWKKRNEKNNRTRRKLERDGTEHRAGYCREKLLNRMNKNSEEKPEGKMKGRK